MAEDKKLKQPDVPAKAESTAVKKGKDGKPIVEDELSEEDAELKNNLEMLVERVKESNLGVQNTALEALRKEIRTSTSSMTSVPKPLKFLRPHYDGLKEVGDIVKIPNKKVSQSALAKRTLMPLSLAILSHLLNHHSSMHKPNGICEYIIVCLNHLQMNQATFQVLFLSRRRSC